ncbi:MAG: hypothetical protein HY023_11300 [Chloroflexi bacterium]|nr:hypothetical protein [Chloroflexota bacterium]MBI3762375.1 hypothetical protein [Chloroflexota bacterium]
MPLVIDSTFELDYKCKHLLAFNLEPDAASILVVESSAETDLAHPFPLWIL